jgi:hypothetical protein
LVLEEILEVKQAKVYGCLKDRKYTGWAYCVSIKMAPSSLSTLHALVDGDVIPMTTNMAVESRKGNIQVGILCL